jgi:hypothetical protein
MRRRAAAGLVSSCSTAIAKPATLTVAPAVSARACRQLVETAASVCFPAQGGVPKRHRRRSLAEALARPRLIPHHLVVGEHLFDGRAL